MVPIFDNGSYFFEEKLATTVFFKSWVNLGKMSLFSKNHGSIKVSVSVTLFFLYKSSFFGFEHRPLHITQEATYKNRGSEF